MFDEAEYWGWRGRIEERVSGQGRKIEEMNGDAKAARKASEQLLIDVAILRTKIAVWSAIGGVTGAGIVSIIVAVVTHVH